MSGDAEGSVRAIQESRCYAQASPARSVATLVYRSRAAQPFSAAELLGLTTDAQTRNRAESITGLVLYDDARFFQWLEGPEENLCRVMQSISNDGRHTDIEVLARQRTGSRTFSGWDMKLALPGAAAAAWTREVITPSLETVEALRRRPEIAASVLERLAPRPAPSGRTRASTILEDMIRARVIPQLASRHGPAQGRAHPASLDRHAADLADILLTGDTAAAVLLITGRGEAARMPPLQTILFEAAARRLGDKWLNDDCSELEVTLALCSLQTIIRRLEQALPAALWPHAQAATVLVTPHPGELHGLGAALSAHAFRRAGWAVRCAFPAVDAELADLVATDRFDVLDLSLSAAFQREDRLAVMAITIARVRSASRNPTLKVSVGGRAFTEQGNRVAQVGADMPSDGPGARRQPSGTRVNA